MKATVLAAVLALSACAPTTNEVAETNWTALVQPADPPPVECTQDPPIEPKMAKRDHTKKESARADRSVRLWGRGVVSQLKRCQTWANGQRQ